MEINYSNEKPIESKYSLFLAGPTPRQSDVISWRPEALKIIENLGFDGVVYVPEYKNDNNYNYLNQVEWEYTCLNQCSIVCFWIPRKLSILPGFTTNIEFGRYVDKSVYGRPDWAEKKGYLDWFYPKITGRKVHNNMYDLFKEAICLTGITH